MADIKVGIQMFSIKAQIAEYGLEPMLRMLAEAGVEYVEIAGYYGLSPIELKGLLDKYGLRAVAAHIKPQDAESTIEYVETLGIEKVYVPIVPLARFGESEYPELVSDIRAAKAIYDARGITYGYHNHKQELDGGDDKIEHLMNEIQGFTSELDIFWARAAGRDPVNMVEKYGNRLSALHIREMDKRANPDNPTEYPHAIVGEGQCRALECYIAARKYGVDTFILEVGAYPIDFRDYIRISIENIKGFEAHYVGG